MALRPRRSEPVFEVSGDLFSEAFLGTLRSPLDRDVPLEGAFAELFARFDALREEFLSGKLDKISFGRLLMDLRVVDDDGVEWTIGATTSRWYKRGGADGNKWNPSPSPGRGGRLVNRFGDATGWAVENWDAKRLETGAGTQEAATAGPKRVRIDDLFTEYVDSETETPVEYGVEEMILPLPEQPDESADWRTAIGYVEDDQ
jgi:hypothetical protein